MAAVGIDVVNPTNNYFYAEVNKFTITAIAEAFELNVQLPKALMDTGFPDGVLVSFSSSPKGKCSMIVKDTRDSLLDIICSISRLAKHDGKAGKKSKKGLGPNLTIMRSYRVLLQQDPCYSNPMHSHKFWMLLAV